MNRKNLTTTFFALVLVLSPIFFVSRHNTAIVSGEETLEEELERIQEEIREIEGEKGDLQSEIDNNQYLIDGFSAEASKLFSEAQVIQKDIDKLELEIKELELNITILNQKIDEKREEIKQSEESIENLESESEQRVEDNYKSFKINGNAEVDSTNIFSSGENINDFFRDSKYVEIIQEDANAILQEVSRLKKELEAKRAELGEQLDTVEFDKDQIEVKRDDLDKKQSEIEVKMAAYYSDISNIQAFIDLNQNAINQLSQEEAEARQRAAEVEQAIFNSFNPPSGGTYVTAGTPIGTQGCTGFCTGPHLHFRLQINGGASLNPCAYLKSGGPVSGCGWGNTIDWPVRGTTYFTSPFGMRGGYFHDAIDLVTETGVIYAAHDGYIHYGIDYCSSYPWLLGVFPCNGGGANYAIICENSNCNSGIKTGYWHLQ